MLGAGFSRWYGKTLTLEELVELLPRLGVACLSGSFRAAESEPAVYMERSGCEYAQRIPGACDFFREAIDGLILGITEDVRHARHASLGHGDPRCVDVLYLRPQSALRFGPIPAEVSERLERVRRLVRAFDSEVALDFLGLSEGTLFYQLSHPRRSGAVSVLALVERELKRRLPELDCREISARPVLSGDAESTRTGRGPTHGSETSGEDHAR